MQDLSFCQDGHACMQLPARAQNMVATHVQPASQLPGSFTFTCVQESCTLMLNDDLLIPFTLHCRGEG